MEDQILVREALNSTYGKSVGCIYFNKSAEQLDLKITDAVLQEIESQVIEVQGKIKSAKANSDIKNKKPRGLLEVLMIYFSHGSILRPSKLREFLLSLTGEVKEEAVLAMSLLWGPRAQNPRPPFPMDLEKEIIALACNGNDREKLIAKIILEGIVAAPLTVRQDSNTNVSEKSHSRQEI